ncbi:MAG: Gfo/Idh/MocA family protein [Gemmataceae bacterium]
MERGNLSRRGFLAQSVAAMTATGLPAWFAREQVAFAEEQLAQRRPAANEKITVGLIGSGSRGNQLLGGALRNQNLQVVATCDVDARRTRETARRIGNNCRQFSDFRELVARDDIDAVIIATPEHWHALTSIAAMKAGKDVYCEKPLTLFLDEGKHMVNVSRETRKILQTGRHQRSESRRNFRLAAELVRNGRIGHVSTIRTLIGTNPQGGPFPVARVPEGLDWDFWLGPCPRVPYVEKRCHYEFRWWYDYSGGKMTDWGAHHNDIAQWALNKDGSGPNMVEKISATPPNPGRNCYNCHERFEVHFTYGEGDNRTVVKCMHDDATAPMNNITFRRRGRMVRANNGVLFEGEAGKWIFVSRSGIQASDPALLNAELPRDAVRLPRNTGHLQDWINCIRDRQQPICNVEVGHRSVSVCHLGTIALRLGGRFQWDPAREQFTGNDQANALLTRPMRAPWRLPS